MKLAESASPSGAQPLLSEFDRNEWGDICHELGMTDEQFNVAWEKFQAEKEIRKKR